MHKFSKKKEVVNTTCDFSIVLAEQLSSFLRMQEHYISSVGKYRILIKWFVRHFKKSNLNSHGVYKVLDIFNTISLKCNVTSYPNLTTAVRDLGTSLTFICV